MKEKELFPTKLNGIEKIVIALKFNISLREIVLKKLLLHSIMFISLRCVLMWKYFRNLILAGRLCFGFEIKLLENYKFQIIFYRPFTRLRILIIM